MVKEVRGRSLSDADPFCVGLGDGLGDPELVISLVHHFVYTLLAISDEVEAVYNGLITISIPIDRVLEYAIFPKGKARERGASKKSLSEGSISETL